MPVPLTNGSYDWPFAESVCDCGSIADLHRRGNSGSQPNFARRTPRSLSLQPLPHDLCHVLGKPGRALYSFERIPRVHLSAPVELLPAVERARHAGGDLRVERVERNDLAGEKL